MNKWQLLIAGPSLLLTFTLGLTACPATTPSGTAKDPETVVFIQGNPLDLVAGAKMNATSPITTENLEQWNEYTLVSYVSFEESPIIKKPKTKNLESLKVENKSEDETKKPQDLKLLKTHVQKTSDTQAEMTLLKGKLKFILDLNTDGKYNIVKAIYKNGVVPITPLHWSESSDGQYLSLLFSAELKESGQTLNAIYWTRNRDHAINVPKVEDKYVYFSGPGNLVGWKVEKGKTLKIDFCSDDNEIYQRTSEELQKWADVLKGRLNLEFARAKEFAPFSDLNQHCIYLSDSYLIEYDHKVAKLGITYNIENYSAAQFIDSDIILFKGEFAKFEKIYEQIGRASEYPEFYEAKLRFTLLHEMGHLLGLGHKFDGTLSVMSYDFNATEPQPYDFEALHLLYPLQ